MKREKYGEFYNYLHTGEFYNYLHTFDAQPTP